MQTRIYHKADGRTLWLYGREPHTLPAQEEGEPAPEPHSHLRWHPVREEWVMYAAHRQGRTFLPPPDHCPLCPARPGGFPGEIPFADYETAVLENRFPTLSRNPGPVPELPAVKAAPGTGRCEVVVYTSDHQGSMATLSTERRELLLQVWAQRFHDLYADPTIAAILPFENRGVEVGVTLHHPHGQIYAYPFVPPVLERESAAFSKRSWIEDLTPRLGDYLVAQAETALAFVPPFARYPYEVWIAPRVRKPLPTDLNPTELSDLATLLGEVTGRYDRLFGRPMPYIMVLHAAPRGDPTFHLHLEFYPVLRAPGKLKYLAGTEVGAGSFAADVLPEQAAEQLRQL